MGRIYEVTFLLLLSLLLISCDKGSAVKTPTESPVECSAESTSPESATPSLTVPGNAYVQSPGGLFLRESASTSSAKLAFMPYGESMWVLAIGETVETLQEATSQWLEVEFFGIRGWAFGGFISDSKPPMAIILGQAVSEAYGYDRLGAYNLDTHQFYTIENHARPFIGGIEDTEMSEAEALEMQEVMRRDYEEACYFEIADVLPGRYSVYTWQSTYTTHALAYMEKGSYDSDANEVQEVNPAVIELDAGEVFPCVFFENSVYFECGGLPGQAESLPLSMKGDFSLGARLCRTTRKTRLFAVPADFLTGKALSGGDVLELEAGTELRADPDLDCLACGFKTLVCVFDDNGDPWWADAFDLAVGCAFVPREYDHGTADFSDAVYILGRSGDSWIYRRMGKDMETGSFPPSSGDIVPGADLIGAGLMTDLALRDFTYSEFSGDLKVFENIRKELDKLDPETDGLADFERYLRPYL